MPCVSCQLLEDWIVLVLLLEIRSAQGGLSGDSGHSPTVWWGTGTDCSILCACPVAAARQCRQVRGWVCPRPGQRAGAGSKPPPAELLPWESCNPPTRSCAGCSSFLYKVAFTKWHCTCILCTLTKASILLPWVLAQAKGRRKRCGRPSLMLLVHNLCFGNRNGISGAYLSVY